MIPIVRQVGCASVTFRAFQVREAFEKCCRRGVKDGTAQSRRRMVWAERREEKMKHEQVMAWGDRGGDDYDYEGRGRVPGGYDQTQDGSPIRATRRDSKLKIVLFFFFILVWSDLRKPSCFGLWSSSSLLFIFPFLLQFDPFYRYSFLCDII
mmetsp:Transcript_6733/g.13463  ORF Transcript_6733/g.13463 Transcript_6733/m.13463 type:complete len:152 (+) Transcript_6733:441-896(+)